MPNVESATVRAGRYNYLFFNRDDTKYIEYYKFTEEQREPKKHRISVKGVEDISIGGAITAVYLERSDEIHVYFIAPAAADDLRPTLAEVCLRDANSDKKMEWTMDGMDLNKKDLEADKNSLLCSTLNANGEPRVCFNSYKKFDSVNFAEFGPVKSGGKDWMTTRLTGLSS